MQRLAQIVHLPAPDCQPADLGQLIQNVRAMFSAELKNRNITWNVNCDGAPVVQLDTQLFEQVLINSVKNAIEGVGQHGMLTVSLRQQAEHVELRIQDSEEA